MALIPKELTRPNWKGGSGGGNKTSKRGSKYLGRDRLLSYSAGMSVSGFPGYGNGVPLPSLVEVLMGKKTKSEYCPC